MEDYEHGVLLDKLLDLARLTIPFAVQTTYKYRHFTKMDRSAVALCVKLLVLTDRLANTGLASITSDKHR